MTKLSENSMSSPNDCASAAKLQMTFTILHVEKDPLREDEVSQVTAFANRRFIGSGKFSPGRPDRKLHYSQKKIIDTSRKKINQLIGYGL